MKSPIAKFKNFNHAPGYHNNPWVYKGHICRMEEEEEEDNRKIFHCITCPDGTEIIANISSYSASMLAMEIYIDLGFPKRTGVGPWHPEELIKLRDKRNK